MTPSSRSSRRCAIKRTDADTMNLLGAGIREGGSSPEKAVRAPALARSCSCPPGWPEPYQSLAAAYTATGEAEQAEWAAAMAEAMAALAEGGSGDTSGAVARLEAIADGDAALDARIGLGLCRASAGDNAAAEGWYRKALELDAESQAAQLGLSRVSGGTQAHPDIMPSPSAEGSN